MENYEFLNTVILRVPRYCKELIDCPQRELLKDPVFRDAISLASECIYDEIKKRDFNPDLFPEKLRQTLQKYQRRMCCRPTPFGAFASISVLEWSKHSIKNSLEICDGSFHTQIHKKFETPLSQQTFYVNPSIYKFGKNYRLYDGMTKDDHGIRIFNLSEIESKGIPAELLRMTGKFKQEDFLKFLSPGDLSEAETCFDELLVNQIILKSGPGIWRRVKTLTSNSSGYEKSSDLYAGTFNKVKGCLDLNIRKKLLEAVNCLNKLMPANEENDLDRFKLRFKDLFDKREVPLLLALDPEAGIDYGQNASWTEADKLGLPSQTNDKLLKWSKVQELLLRKWTAQHDAKLPVISIEKEDLLLLNDGPAARPALSQAVLFNILDDQLHIQAAGGSSAAAIIGRFTFFDNDILEIARRICVMEKEANPDVIFAELIHDSEEKTDKLNKRAHFRDYVIPVLTDTEIPEECRIELNDLCLSLLNGQLILRSKRLNKRIIPRLSTSWNYRRNPLSIYRFLCDLQNEAIHPGVSLNMSKLLPGLRFYPRVCFQNVILETASWHADPQIFRELHSRPVTFYAEFLKYADKLGLPEAFTYDQNDQRLLIQKNNEEDVWLLINTVKNQMDIVLREYLKEEKALVKGENGGTFIHELIAFLINKEQVYTGLPLNHQIHSLGISRFYPLKDWHFLKIYMHPSGMNEFLTKTLEGFIRNCFKAGLLKSWYFIRYNDGDDHLRIRLKIASSEDLLLIKKLQIFLSSLKKKPCIRHVQFCTYERELERYHSIGIDNAESLFSLSSDLALFMIKSGTHADEIENPFDSREASQTELLIHAVFHMHEVLKHGGLTEPAILLFAEESFTRLFSRLKTSKELKANLDQKYRQTAGLPVDIFNSKLTTVENEYFAQLSKNIKNVNIDMRPTLLADLIHMHINRLFASRQQLAEAECYYFLYKTLLKRKFKMAAARLFSASPRDSLGAGDSRTHRP